MEPYCITVSTLKNLVVCERHSWLDKRGDKRLRVLKPSILARLEMEPEVQILNATRPGPIQSIPMVSRSEGVETVRQKLDEGTEVSQAGPYGSTLTIKGFFLPSEK